MSREWSVLAGPPQFGRSLIVAPGHDAPAPWSDAPRLRVDADTVSSPDETVATLQGHWSSRQRYVVELAVAIGATKEPVIETRPAWELGPRFELMRERLHHLIWSNAVDARDPDQPAWWWSRKAMTAGATAGTDADVTLTDGRMAWLDGGPLTPFDPSDVGAPVVPGVNIERGVLEPFGAAPPAADLAPDQLAAVAHRAGGARIVAPAGSGKTRVLTERARHLLLQRRVAASALGLVAFNVRAAEEMRTRTSDLPGLRVHTLNGLGLAVLNGSGPFVVPAGRTGATRVADERDVRDILARLVAMPRRANTDPAAAWIDALSAVRLGLRDPAEVEAAFAGETPGLAELVPRYRGFLTDHDLVDFDEQIATAAEVLAAQPVARAAAQRACRVLLVDEFQDLTPGHVLLLRLLAAPGFDVFGVGDDDQTIYGYTGASPAWLIDFAGLFPGAGTHALTVNYRCPPAVVGAAANLLTRNRMRLAKSIEPRPGRPQKPEDLTVEQADDCVEATVNSVRAALAGGRSPAEVVVLARVNASLAPIQITLAAAGVACTPVVDAAFCERTGVRVALAWLRLATGGSRLRADDLSETARRIQRRPSPRAVEWIAEKRTHAALHAFADRLGDDRVHGYMDALEAVTAAARISTGAALEEIRARTGLDSAMDALDTASVGRNKGGHSDDLNALAALASAEPAADRFEAWLRAALQARPGTAGDDVVTLATVHRVKGQEWPVVVVHDASAEQFPHRLADDVEEERRVFHVAMTRAIDQCVVIAPKRAPSPFLDELAAPGSPPVTRAPEVTERRRDRSPIDDALFESLRRWRNEARDGKPAYTVLANEALTWIAEHRPSTLTQLARCPGIGPTKLDRYGADLLALVEAAAG